MPIARLDDRAIITVSGADAEHFLQNIVTSDLDALGAGAGAARRAADAAGQDPVRFPGFAARARTACGSNAAADVADDFVRRLMLYRLRAKVEIAKQDQPSVAVSWQSDSAASQS